MEHVTSNTFEELLIGQTLLSCGHKVHFNPFYWTCYSSLYQPDTSTCEQFLDRFVIFDSLWKVLIVKVWESNHQWILISVFENNSTKIGQ